MPRWLARVVFRIVWGMPRPCGDEQCVEQSPEQHGISRADTLNQIHGGSS